MIFTQLLVIQLIPDFILMAAIVVIAHWIWLFGFKKGGYQPATSLKATNNNTNTQPLETAIAASCIASIPRPSMSAAALKESEDDHSENDDHTTSPETPAQEELEEAAAKASEDTPFETQPREPGAPMNVRSSQEDIEQKVRQRYAGLNMVEWLLYLQQSGVKDNSLSAMDILSRLTISDAQRYGEAIDCLPSLFTPKGEKPSLTLLN